MNDSINETLSRTVLTSGVTLICMLSLWIFGGPVLDDFAFTNVVGVMSRLAPVGESSWLITRVTLIPLAFSLS